MIKTLNPNKINQTHVIIIIKTKNISNNYVNKTNKQKVNQPHEKICKRPMAKFYGPRK